MLTTMLDGKHIAIQLGDPLPALHRQLQMTDCGTNVRLDLVPKEVGIPFSEIGWSGVTQLLIDTCLGELMKQCIELAWIKRISQLPNQIGRPNQASFGVGFSVIPIVWYGEPGQLDGPYNPFAIYHRVRRETLAHRELRTRDVVRSQEGI